MRSYLNPESVSRGHYQFQDKTIEGLKDENLKNKLMEKIEELYFQILLYANDDVIISIRSFIKIPSEQNWLNTIISMRSDLWSNTKLKGNEIKL